MNEGTSEPGTEEEPDSPWYDPTRWLVTLVAMWFVTVGAQTWIPGLDVVVFQQFQVKPIGIIGSNDALAILVIFRGLLALRERPSVEQQRAAFALFCVCTAVWAWGFAHSLLQMRIGQAWVVIEPGQMWLGVTVLTLVAGNAICWALATWISRAGVGSGPLLLFGSVLSIQAVGNAYDVGEILALGGDLQLSLMFPLLSIVVVLLGLAASLPEFPWAVRDDLRLRSPVDVLVLPLVVGGLIAIPLSMSARAWMFDWIGDAATLFAAMLVVAHLVQAKGSRQIVPALLAFVPASALAVFLAIGFARSGGLERLMAPGPFDGTASARVVAHSADPGPGDADVIRARLDALGVEHTMTGQGGQLTIDLRDVVGPNEVTNAFLPRRALYFHVVDEDKTRLALASGPNASFAPGLLVVYDCAGQPVGSPYCRPLVVEPAVIGPEHIADASVGWSQYSEPLVLISFTPTGTQLFGDVTTEIVNSRFAMVIDGAVLSAPTVRSPITGGRAQIEMGNQGMPGDAEKEARMLVVALTTEPLVGTWNLLSVAPIP